MQFGISLLRTALRNSYLWGEKSLTR